MNKKKPSLQPLLKKVLSQIHLLPFKINTMYNIMIKELAKIVKNL